MKRTPITKKKTKRLSEYDREFERMKPLVKERSFGLCESWTFVSQHMGDEAKDLYSGLIIASTCEFKNPVHVHHRKYRSRGGTNSLNNLVHLCQPCHSFTHAHGGFGEPANLLGLALSAGQSEEL